MNSVSITFEHAVIVRGAGVQGEVLSLPPKPTGYAGDMSPDVACALWKSGAAVLVDVRTDAERDWVGFIPGAKAIAWKQWPAMDINPLFDDALTEAVQPCGTRVKVLFICRSGVRSIAAARRATELGLDIEAYNVLEGFEGNLDESAHRGNISGWRSRALPWKQT